MVQTRELKSENLILVGLQNETYEKKKWIRLVVRDLASLLAIFLLIDFDIQLCGVKHLSLDLSKAVLKVSLVTGFSSMFNLSKQTNELINLLCFSQSWNLFCFQLKKLENTYNGTSAVGMRAIVPDSDQNPFSVYETTLNDAKM
jgi:hypothetical protein